MSPYLIDNYEPGGSQVADYPEYDPNPPGGVPSNPPFPVGRFFTYDQISSQSEWIINGDSFEPVGLKPGVSSGNAFWRLNLTDSNRRWRGGEPDRHSGLDYKDKMSANYLYVDGHASSLEAEEAAVTLRDPERKNGFGYIDPQ